MRKYALVDVTGYEIFFFHITVDKAVYSVIVIYIIYYYYYINKASHKLAVI